MAFLLHRAPTQSVCVTDCNFIVNVLVLPFASSVAISLLNVYMNQCYINVVLPHLRYVVLLLPEKQYFDRF